LNGFGIIFRTGYNVKKIKKILKQVQDDRGNLTG